MNNSFESVDFKMVCLSGEDSVLAPLLEMCPGGEIDSHLEGSEREFSKLP